MPTTAHSYTDVSEALDGFLTAGLWATVDPDFERDERSGECLDARYNVDDLPADYVIGVRHMVATFLEANAERLARFMELTGRPLDHVGHDLFLTSAHHGVGFWDRYLEAEISDRDEVRELGDRLSDAAHELADPSDGIMEACWRSNR